MGIHISRGYTYHCEKRERGTGNRERESGNECTAVIRIRIQSGGRKHGKRVWEPVLSTRSSNSIVGANNMVSKCSIY